jgi:hypothetical protein
MTKAELAAYLANLLSIDTYLASLGVARPWLNAEEARILDLLQKEIESEAGKSIR